VLCDNGYLPIATDFPSTKYSPATLIHFSRFRASAKWLLFWHNIITHCLENVLIYPFETERLELFPVKCTFTSARGAAEQHNFLVVLLGVDIGCYIIISFRVRLLHNVS
jgi:hypothetical protein